MRWRNIQERNRVLIRIFFFLQQQEKTQAKWASWIINFKWIFGARVTSRTSCVSKDIYDPHASARLAMCCARWLNNTTLWLTDRELRKQQLNIHIASKRQPRPMEPPDIECDFKSITTYNPNDRKCFRKDYVFWTNRLCISSPRHIPTSLEHKKAQDFAKLQILSNKHRRTRSKTFLISARKVMQHNQFKQQGQVIQEHQMKDKNIL